MKPGINSITMAHLTSSASSFSWDEIDLTTWLQGTSEDPASTLDAGDDHRRVTANQEGSGRSEFAPPTTSKPRRLACLACRHRKVRCSGGQGSCQRCTRMGHECIYDKGSGSGLDPRSQSYEEMKSRLGMAQKVAVMNSSLNTVKLILADHLEKLFSQQNSRSPSAPSHPAANHEASGKVFQGEMNRDSDLSSNPNLTASAAPSIDSFYGVHTMPSAAVLADLCEHDAAAIEHSPEAANLGQVSPSTSLDQSNAFSIQLPNVEEVTLEKHASHETHSASSPPLLHLLQNGWHGL